MGLDVMNMSSTTSKITVGYINVSSVVICLYTPGLLSPCEQLFSECPLVYSRTYILSLCTQPPVYIPYNKVACQWWTKLTPQQNVSDQVELITIHFLGREKGLCHGEKKCTTVISLCITNLKDLS